MLCHTTLYYTILYYTEIYYTILYFNFSVELIYPQSFLQAAPEDPHFRIRPAFITRVSTPL